MVNEHVDPVYKYVDRKINSIKKDFKEEIRKLSKDLLNTERVLAKEIVAIIHDNSTTLLNEHKIQNSDSIFTQFVVDTMAIFEKINNENKPLAPLVLAISFRKKRVKDLEKLGIEFIKTNLTFE